MKNTEIKYGVLEGMSLMLFPKATSVKTTAFSYLMHKIKEGGFAKAGKIEDQIRAYVKDWEEYYNWIALEDGYDMEYDVETTIDQIAEHLTYSDGMLIDRSKRATASETDQETFRMTIENVLRGAH
jgi:NAD-dependent DNA ligase